MDKSGFVQKRIKDLIKELMGKAQIYLLIFLYRNSNKSSNNLQVFKITYLIRNINDKIIEIILIKKEHLKINLVKCCPFINSPKQEPNIILYETLLVITEENLKNNKLDILLSKYTKIMEGLLRLVENKILFCQFMEIKY